MPKKLTITDILAQKEAAKKKKLATQTLYVKSLDAEITVQEPTKALILESREFNDGAQSDAFIVYHCVIDPNLQGSHNELMAHFNCTTPFEIVEHLFKPGEAQEIAFQIMELAGYSRDGSSVRIAKEVKN